MGAQKDKGVPAVLRSNQARTTVFLGAGASAQFGYPLNDELLGKILLGLDHETLFGRGRAEKNNRAWFKDRLLGFVPGLADRWAAIHTRNGSPPCLRELGVSITDVITLVDRAVQLGEARAKMTPNDLGRFRMLFERATYDVISSSGATHGSEAQVRLQEFIRWLDRLKGPVCILTTNYDMAVDRRLFRKVSHSRSVAREELVRKRIDFGFPWKSPNTGDLVTRPLEPRWRLFKLHGSFNWLRCRVCGQNYLNVHGAIGSLAYWERVRRWNTCHCNDWAGLEAHFVAPSLLRNRTELQLLQVWQAALEELGVTDRWVIIGYSLPPEDIAIRALFLRGWEAHRRKERLRIDVVQYDKDGRENATERAYHSFFPSKNLHYVRTGLADFLDQELRPKRSAASRGSRT
jgi:NAD-dependent SIR2 family protein deacetylase